MSKIIGVTVGTQLPKPNFKQDDPTKGDYIKNKPVALTNDEIDAICGGALTLDITESVLTDISTGVLYKIYVENGKLNMKELGDIANIESTNTEHVNIEKLMLVDITTDAVHEVYVENGKLHMTEVE